ncbi:hypothetical protein MTR67_025628 [Solanum verrucosum]|uniref:Uncharacterized protein n=1 Tax=Solanum verrucosum TaxID=315347 RepID=A0AAF0TZG1_SOLVR|nr:hypothetical protein MTR67_025628 [Solanum verrucosum]
MSARLRVRLGTNNGS